MAQKSRDLDRQLAEIITPLGFKRIPKTRYFIRLCGDGVLQGIHWYHEPRYTAQELAIWIDSIYADPDYLFRPYLSWHDFAMMLCPISCAAEIYGDNEYIPVRVFCEYTEEEQLEYFRKQVLPRLERWKTEEDVFRARHGGEIAAAEGYPLFSPRYSWGRGLNLAMYLNLPDEAEKYLNEPIAFNQNCEDIERNRGDQEAAERHRKDKEKWMQRKAFIKGDGSHSSNEIAQRYLQLCKEQNMYDYERILKGERGMQRFLVSEDSAERPFFQLVIDGEDIPLHWGKDIM